VRPMAAALTGALISGVAMYAIGVRAQDRFSMNPAMMGNPAMVGNPAMGYYTGSSQGLAQPVGYLTTTPQPYATPVYYTPAPQVAAPARQVVQRRAAAPRQTVYRTVESEPTYRTVETAPHRSLAKTALIIGGTAASGAGVGGIVGGKKGALLGAAIGGGAASIYEATRR
jgi:hypothetical protein